MKANFKKIAAAVLALCMVIAMSATVFAADANYYVAGTEGLCGEGWNPNAEANKMALNADGLYEKVFENVPAGTHEFKVTPGSWDQSWGVDGGNSNFVFDLKEAATVTILFDESSKHPSVLINGEAYEAAKGYFVAGCEALTGYNWAVNAPANVMSKNADGLYELVYENVPAGNYDFKVTPGNWDQSWGANGGNENYWITLEKASKVTILFNEETKIITHVAEEIADAPVEPPKPDVYTVAGSEKLCGYNWDPNQNQMVLNADGLYAITFQNIFMGDYELKVIANGDWNTCWGGDGPGGNYMLKLEQSGHVTILFNAETKAITWSVEPAEVVAPEDIYVLAGDEGLCGIAWNLESNEMAKNADGLYEITFSEVAAGSYGFKVVANRNWNTCWGQNGENYPVTLEDKSKVTILFDPASGAIAVNIESLEPETPVDPPVDPVDPPVEPDVPNAGDTTIVFVMMLMGAAMAAIVVLTKKQVR